MVAGIVSACDVFIIVGYRLKKVFLKGFFVVSQTESFKYYSVNNKLPESNLLVNRGYNRGNMKNIRNHEQADWHSSERGYRRHPRGDECEARKEEECVGKGAYGAAVV